MFPYTTQKVFHEDRVHELLEDARIEETAPEDKGSRIRHLLSGLRNGLSALDQQDQPGDCTQTPSPAK